MARDDSRPPRDPESKRSGTGGSQRTGHAAGWVPRRGRSGYGIESIRPHLHAQLEQQKLLRPTFPPEAPEEDEGPR